MKKELGHPQVSTTNLPLIFQIRFNAYLVGLWSICTRLQVSWRKVLDLDKHDEKAERDRFDWEEEDNEAVPDRLLAAGPTDNQVIIFRKEGCLTRIVQSQGLVFKAVGGQKLQ